MDYREGERTIPTSDRSNGWTVETVKRALHSQPTHIYTHTSISSVLASAMKRWRLRGETSELASSSGEEERYGGGCGERGSVHTPRRGKASAQWGRRR